MFISSSHSTRGARLFIACSTKVEAGYLLFSVNHPTGVISWDIYHPTCGLRAWSSLVQTKCHWDVTPFYGKGAQAHFLWSLSSWTHWSVFPSLGCCQLQNSAYKAVSKGPVQSSSDDGSSTSSRSLSNCRNVFLSSMELEKYRQCPDIFSIS